MRILICLSRELDNFCLINQYTEVFPKVEDNTERQDAFNDTVTSLLRYFKKFQHQTLDSLTPLWGKYMFIYLHVEQ